MKIRNMLNFIKKLFKLRPKRKKITKGLKITVTSPFHGFAGPTTAEHYVYAYNQSDELAEKYANHTPLRATKINVGDIIIVADTQFASYCGIVSFLTPNGEYLWTSYSALWHQINMNS